MPALILLNICVDFIKFLGYKVTVVTFLESASTQSSALISVKFGPKLTVVKFWQLPKVSRC
jgi:hypothetical protein